MNEDEINKENGKKILNTIVIVGVSIFLIYNYFNKNTDNKKPNKTEFENTIRSLFSEKQFIIENRKNAKKELEKFNNYYIDKYISIKGYAEEFKCRNTYPKEHVKKCYIRTIVKVSKKVSPKSKNLAIYIYGTEKLENKIQNLKKYDEIKMICKFKDIGSYQECKEEELYSYKKEKITLNDLTSKNILNPPNINEKNTRQNENIELLKKYPKLSKKIEEQYKEEPLFYEPSKDNTTLKIQKIIYGY